MSQGRCEITLTFRETELPSSISRPALLMLAAMNVQLPQFQMCDFSLRSITSVLSVYREVLLWLRMDDDKRERGCSDDHGAYMLHRKRSESKSGLMCRDLAEK